MEEVEENKAKSFLANLSKIIIHPIDFFSGVKEEKGMGRAIGTYFLVYVVLGILGSLGIYSIMNAMGSRYGFFGISVEFVTVFFAFGIFIGIIFTFILAGIMHVAVKAVEGKGNFAATYRVVAYSCLVISLSPFLLWFGFLFWIYSLVLVVIGMYKVHEISVARAIVVALSPLVAVVVIVMMALTGEWWIG